MFANRFTALEDACALVPALKRNLLCSLAEGEFFRIRWSARVLDETERAIAKVLAQRGVGDAAGQARDARQGMEEAFEDALVCGFEVQGSSTFEGLPDPNDAHVIAAALQTQAQVIVTDNIRDFPERVLRP